MTAALAVTDEMALPIRAVGDLAAAAEVSREEVAVITQFAALEMKFLGSSRQSSVAWSHSTLAIVSFEFQCSIHCWYTGLEVMSSEATGSRRRRQAHRSGDGSRPRPATCSDDGVAAAMGLLLHRGGHADGDCVVLARYLATWATLGHGMEALTTLVI